MCTHSFDFVDDTHLVVGKTDDLLLYRFDAQVENTTDHSTALHFICSLQLPEIGLGGLSSEIQLHRAIASAASGLRSAGTPFASASAASILAWDNMYIRNSVEHTVRLYTCLHPTSLLKIITEAPASVLPWAAWGAPSARIIEVPALMVGPSWYDALGSKALLAHCDMSRDVLLVQVFECCQTAVRREMQLGLAPRTHYMMDPSRFAAAEWFKEDVVSSLPWRKTEWAIKQLPETEDTWAVLMYEDGFVVEVRLSVDMI